MNELFRNYTQIDNEWEIVALVRRIDEIVETFFLFYR